MIKIVTFDIFDTCLIRASGSPESVFRLLARKVTTGAKGDILDFIRVRKDGEYNARVSSKREVTLDEIYEHCNFSSLSKMTNNDIMRIEMDIERDVLVPVERIRNTIARHRKQGARIGFISDMYLSAEFLKSILKEKGLYEEGDLLLVSSESKKTKAQGSLYKLLKDKYPEARFGTWLHYGDNLRSDCINSMKAGALPIIVNHRKNDSEIINLNRFIPILNSNILISNSISKSLRLSSPSNQYYSFAVDVIAPIYVPFVWDILSKAKKNNFSDLYFFARDSLIFYEIAKVFSSYYSSINLHYIYVSRKSIYFPTISDFSRESIKTLFSEEEKSLLRILADLCLEKDDFSLEQWEELNQQKNMNDIVDFLFSDKELYEKIKQRYEVQRFLFLEYLKQESVARNSLSCAIVDLRGTRKSHERINSFLIKNGYKPIYGFYFEVLDNRAYPSNAPLYDSNIYREEFIGSSYYEALQNSTALFEQFFSITPHNRTSHYCKDIYGNIKPVFDKENPNDKSVMLYNNNLKACLDYASYYLKFIDLDYSVIISQFFLMNFLMLMKQPTHHFLNLLDGLKVTENEFDNRVFVKKLSLSNLLKYNIVWKTGSAVYTFGALARFLIKLKNYLRQWIISK